MNTIPVSYQTGLPEQFRSEAARLYDEAFGTKFSLAVGSQSARISLLTKALMPEYAIVAVSQDRLLGIAGFHRSGGSLTGGITYSGLISQLGLIRGNWAALIFSLYERKPRPGELVMDGIAVHKDARGRGIGSRLLEEIKSYAKEQGFDRVRLDVIDINPQARKLYEREGFTPVKTERFGYLRWLLGFGGSTTMELRLHSHTRQGI